MFSFHLSNMYKLFISGPKVLPYKETKERIKEILNNIQNGNFVSELMKESSASRPEIIVTFLQNLTEPIL